MNRSIRTALTATTLALGALTVTTGVAQAETPAPQSSYDIAVPDRDGHRPTPRPQGPGDLIDDTCPTHGACSPADPEPTRPDGPGDVTQNPPCPTHGDCGGGSDPTRPDGPGDVTSNPPCPTQGECGGGDDPTRPDGPGDLADIPRPTRIDTGGGGLDGGIDIIWLLAGGAIVTVTGGAFIGRTVTARGRR